mmetsp:Transcript_19286/g.23480  ORF Transcript_19286/g.23480 Transcript_19286/m.23480 type:complete len:236 (+) Transcript_19286:184-891(+)|eukprot:CAMPEP_0204827960 /NCGR_PEP_ID=MMETSP1346-20131115/5506_1 /ASSEMBLY_ACC=CAM_ASM_000771 /TAXON_ID=215587 /ORGANISM="Aplanochytrium stocchinoi, Strain GSBS06" /LENGTH=235 /DNA_ID=CAMNT_0051956673 /DNA_START=244 /DNA_END=951 /DNA_ORIENTATION=-
MKTVSKSSVFLTVLCALGVSQAFAEEDAKAAGEAFLKENANKEGVVSLPSGLQYKVLNSGSGVYHPTVNSPCTCHYHGTLINGEVFDSSVDRGTPIDFAPNQVIAGWTEAMQLMVEGDKFELYIPSDLAYGDRGSPPKIPGGATLVFTIEMIEIKGEKVPALKCDPTNESKNCNEKEIAYIEKKKSLAAEKISAEIDRLALMKAGKMKPELVEWIERRINILTKLKEGANVDKEL